jgi:hypothetical protein
MLPGLLSVMRVLDKKGTKPVAFLRMLAQDANPGLKIVNKAVALLASREPSRRRGVFRQPKIAELAFQVLEKVKVDRLSAAAGLVERIHGIMEGVRQQAPLSLEEIRTKIAELNPPGEEDDILPDLVDDEEEEDEPAAEEHPARVTGGRRAYPGDFSD